MARGLPVAASSRAGSGRMFHTSRMKAAGFLNADNLTPQKARILLMLGLTVTRDPAALEAMFATY
jgi:L-asparaginase